MVKDKAGIAKASGGAVFIDGDCPMRENIRRRIVLMSVTVPTVECEPQPIRFWSTTMDMLRFSMGSTSGWENFGKKVGKSKVASTHPGQRYLYFRTHILISQDGIDHQLTAFFTSAAIFASSAAVNLIRAKPAAHILPSSRFASGWKPNVAYLTLNLLAA